jgi:hypothetical protein
VPAAPLPRVNDSAAFNAGLITSAMEKLNDWWSQQPAAADRTAATLAEVISPRTSR